MQKIKKKKKEKKIFHGTFSLANFLFSVIKRAEKVSAFVFFRKVRGKKKSNFKKKVLMSFFRHYLCEKRSVCGEVYVFV